MAKVTVEADDEAIEVMLFVANADAPGWSNGETIVVAPRTAQTFDVHAEQGVSIKERAAPATTDA